MPEGTPAPTASTSGGVALAAPDHLCLEYDSDRQRDRAQVELLADGLRAGHQCFCLAPAGGQPTIAARVAERCGLVGQVGDEPAGDWLTFVSPDQSYLQGGRFSSRRMHQLWPDWAARTYERCTFARIVADMSWAVPFLTRCFEDDRVRYEARFTVWSQAYPLATVCMYDTRAFPEDLLVRISAVHSQLWIDGRVVPNPSHFDLALIMGEQ